MLGLEPVIVNADHDGIIDRVLRRHGQHDALGAGLQMFAELFPAGEYSGRFYDGIDGKVAPRQFKRILFAQHAGSTVRGDQLIAFEP